MIRRLIILLLIVGCDNSTEPEDHPLVGVWVFSESSINIGGEITTTSADNLNWETLIFNSDGSFSYEQMIDGETDTGNGTWSTNGNKMTFIVEGVTQIYDYLINGAVFTYSYEIINPSDGSTLYAERIYTKSN